MSLVVIMTVNLYVFCICARQKKPKKYHYWSMYLLRGERMTAKDGERIWHDLRQQQVTDERKE